MYFYTLLLHVITKKLTYSFVNKKIAFFVRKQTLNTHFYSNSDIWLQNCVSIFFCMNFIYAKSSCFQYVQGKISICFNARIFHYFFNQIMIKWDLLIEWFYKIKKTFRINCQTNSFSRNFIPVRRIFSLLGGSLMHPESGVDHGEILLFPSLSNTRVSLLNPTSGRQMLFGKKGSNPCAEKTHPKPVDRIPGGSQCSLNLINFNLMYPCPAIQQLKALHPSSP